MLNVVVVDDQATDRQILEQLLRNLEEDIDAKGFASPSAALEWLRENQPDLILVDYRMPEMNGLEFIRALRELPSCKGIPLVVITVVDDAELRYSALELGATDFLTKPLDLEECQARARNLLTLRRQQLTISRHAEHLAVARHRTSRALSTLSAGNELLLGTADEHDLLQGMCHTLTREAGYPMARIGLWDHHNEVYEVAYADAHVGDHGIGFSHPVLADAANRVREQAAPYVVNDLEPSQPVYPAGHEMLSNAGFRAMALLPVWVEGVVEGVVAVLADTKDCFDEDELDLLQRNANNLGFGLASRRARRARERAEHECRFLTQFDRLTGLPNRNRLFQRLRELSEDDTSGHAALLTINLDRFKQVNNTAGHHAGDRLLLQSVRRLQAILGERELLARKEGDEFVILMVPEAAAGADEIEPQAMRMADRAVEALKQPVRIAGYDYHLGASIGIRTFERRDVYPDTLLSQADAAMRQAKEAGGNQSFFYRGELTERHTRRLSLESRLRHAAENGDFVLHYQPITDLETGRTAGVEALIRWPQEDGSLMSPDGFIPIAEEAGLMGPIGLWVFGAACRQAEEWAKRGFAPYVSINLSVHQLVSPDLADGLAGIIDELGTRWEDIELEVTESALMTDSARTERTLRELQKRGVGLALDDFGMGYSSLSRLKHLPITTLKVDKSFVRTLPTDPDDRTIVRSIVNLADNLGLKVVAEGIETPEHQRLLRKIGCHLGQGFLFCEPMAADALWERLFAGDPDSGSDPGGAAYGTSDF